MGDHHGLLREGVLLSQHYYWIEARGRRFVKLADSSHELERSNRNPLAVTGGMPLCISLGAKSLHDVDARGAGGRHPGRDDRGRH